MRKFVKVEHLAVVAAAATMAVSGSTSAMAAGNGGNSDAAKACQQGGYQAWTRSDGTAFANTGDCVSYAAHGGSLQQQVETVTVNSANPADTAAGSLPAGHYVFVASGTWDNESHGVVDAAYNAGDSFDWNNPNPAIQQGWPGLGAGELQLQVDDAFVNWGSYSSSHTYSLDAGTVSGVPMFRVFDGDASQTPAIQNPGWYGDNSGSLTVTIYRLFN